MVLIRKLIQSGLLKVISFYQTFISPLLGPRCRFYPTCSDYAHTCIKKYPLAKALLMIIKRISRCQPWHPGGFDYP